MFKKTALLTAIAGLTLATGSASAAALVEESFNDLAGGTGVGAWTTSGMSLEAESLDYGDLAHAGSQVAGVGLPQARASANITADISSLLTDGGELWFSVMHDPGSGGGNQHAGFAIGTNFTYAHFNGQRLNGDGVGFYSKGQQVRAAGWTSNVDELPASLSSGLSTPVGNSVLVVGKIEWGATAGDVETITLYTPDTSDLGTLGASVSTTIAGVDQTAFNIVSFTNRDSQAVDQIYDEIRVGATSADVLPVPEPSSLALLGLGGLLIARRRRG